MARRWHICWSTQKLGSAPRPYAGCASPNLGVPLRSSHDARRELVHREERDCRPQTTSASPPVGGLSMTRAEHRRNSLQSPARLANRASAPGFTDPGFGCAAMLWAAPVVDWPDEDDNGRLRWNTRRLVEWAADRRCRPDMGGRRASLPPAPCGPTPRSHGRGFIPHCAMAGERRFYGVTASRRRERFVQSQGTVMKRRGHKSIEGRAGGAPSIASTA
jgi:hypothetical protein